MDEQEFEEIYERLRRSSPRLHDVLIGLLAGKTEQEIAESRGRAESTVRKQLSNLYALFGLTGKHRVKRYDLIDLFKKYRPMLVSSTSAVPTSQQILSETIPLNSPFYLERETDVLLKQLPQGIISLDSPLYIERETDILLKQLFSTQTRDALLFIRLKGSKGTGKSSLLVRLRQFLEEQGHIVGVVNLGGANFTPEILSNLDELLYQFTYDVCRAFKKALGNYEPPDLKTYWRSDLAPGLNCTDYLHDHIFSKIQQPKTLLIDGIDAVLDYEKTCIQFSDILRSWNEEKMKRVSSEPIVWANLVIAYSTEPYANYEDITGSPLQNVGISLELPEFTAEQVLQQAKKLGLDWDLSQVKQLMEWVDGHPQLVNRSLSLIKEGKINLDNFYEEATQSPDNFGDFLLRNLKLLQEHSKLAECFIDIANGQQGKDVFARFQLEKAGLIKIENSQICATNKLYQEYFKKCLQSNYGN